MVFRACVSGLPSVFHHPPSATANLNFMSPAILTQGNDLPVRAGVSGIVAQLRKAIRIEIPLGYQDETSFHLGDESILYRKTKNSAPCPARFGKAVLKAFDK